MEFFCRGAACCAPTMLRTKLAAGSGSGAAPQRRSCVGNPLFARKPMSMLLAEAQEVGGQSLKRTIGPFQIKALGVGEMSGAGIFALFGVWAYETGAGLILSFVLARRG